MVSKRNLFLSIVGSFFLVLAVSQFAFSKAHVPVHKVQVCHDGDDGPETITVSANALPAHLNHGDFQLPACDFNNVFLTGDPCDVDLGPRADACGATPACLDGPNCF